MYRRATTAPSISGSSVSNAVISSSVEHEEKVGPGMCAILCSEGVARDERVDGVESLPQALG